MPETTLPPRSFGEVTASVEVQSSAARSPIHRRPIADSGGNSGDVLPSLMTQLTKVLQVRSSGRNVDATADAANIDGQTPSSSSFAIESSYFDLDNDDADDYDQIDMNTSNVNRQNSNVVPARYMDDAIYLLLLLDSSYLPNALEWSKSIGASEYVLFLLEADSLRFKITETETARTLTRLASSYLQPGNSIHGLLPDSVKRSINNLIARRIPLRCGLAVASEVIWDKLMKHCAHLQDSKFWPGLRRLLTGDVEMDLSEIIEKRRNRKYFEKFLGENPPELACLLCWRDAHDTLKALELGKRQVWLLQLLPPSMLL